MFVFYLPLKLHARVCVYFCATLYLYFSRVILTVFCLFYNFLNFVSPPAKRSICIPSLFNTRDATMLLTFFCFISISLTRIRFLLEKKYRRLKIKNFHLGCKRKNTITDQTKMNSHTGRQARPDLSKL